VALVTGAGRGLGREYALLLASEGARVVVNDLGGDTRGGRAGSPAPVDEVVAAIAAAGGEAIADAHDVVEGAGAIVARALDRWGRLDLVVNNAGIAGGGEIDQIPVELYDRMIDVHYRGSVAVLRAAWPVMRAQGYGRVVNTSSGSVMGVPFSSAYVSAKSAIIGLTRALALDGRKHDIKVNAIMPIAFTRLTEQIPDDDFRAFLAARFEPAKVAPFVAALLSDDVPCSGEVFSVGAGIAARVVLGTVPGYVSAEPSIEEYLAHFDEVCDIGGLFVPGNSMEEVAHRAAQLGIDLANPTLGN
jgi:NAD(P)-dependent dehydrogenase (short-subunit alcohol dehydrogenase family)